MGQIQALNGLKYRAGESLIQLPGIQRQTLMCYQWLVARPEVPFSSKCYSTHAMAVPVVSLMDVCEAVTQITLYICQI